MQRCAQANEQVPDQQPVPNGPLRRADPIGRTIHASAIVPASAVTSRRSALIRRVRVPYIAAQLKSTTTTLRPWPSRHVATHSLSVHGHELSRPRDDASHERHGSVRRHDPNLPMLRAPIHGTIFRGWAAPLRPERV
jgi:hypothetical protein